MKPSRLIAASAAALLIALHPSASRSAQTGLALVPTQGEARLMGLINSERAVHAERPLVWDATLCAAARQHSREMADMAYFDHRSPVRGLETPADRWERINPSAPAEYTIGENLFYGSMADVGWSHRSLMASPEHRANILNPGYSHAGVGIYVSRTGEMWVTEMFVS